MKIEREGSLSAPMKTVKKINTKAFIQAESFHQLSLPEDFSPQARDAFLFLDDCVNSGFSAATGLTILSDHGVEKEQVKACIFLTCGISSLRRVDTWNLFLHAHPSLKALLDTPPTEAELRLMQQMQEGDQALRAKGLKKHLGMWSGGAGVWPSPCCLLPACG